MNGDLAARVFLDSLSPESSVLDIGAGEDGGGFGLMARRAGHHYEAFDWRNGDDWEAPILRPSLLQRFDGVYMCHVLEHLLDTHSALTRVHQVLKPGGVLAVTVPPLKHSIVGGHVSLWNAGLLLYRLIMARFDCSNAAVKTYGYNVSVIVRRREIELPPLKRDYGDIQALREFFPKPFDHGFDGQISELNWRVV